MEGGGGREGRGGQQVVVVGRAEIDTRAPFRSVKEAVALFGEKVLAGELCAGRRLTVNENRAVATRPNHHHTAAAVPTAAVVSVKQHQLPPAPPVTTTTELAVAKQALEKEREEKQRMAGCIQTLQAELSNAQRELKRLKEDQEAKVIDLQVDELKFVEDEKQQHPPPPADDHDDNNSGGGCEVQKKRYVTFADPPTSRAPPVADAVTTTTVEQLPRAPSQPHYYREPRFQRQMSAGHEPVKAAAAVAAREEEGRKKKKKPLIPLVGALFGRRKKSSCHDHDNSF